MDRDGAFFVRKSYFHAAHDLVVLAGAIVRSPVEAGMWIDMPVRLMGPGRVPILTVETIQFANNKTELCLTIAWHHFEKAPFFEVATTEGQTLPCFG